MYDVYDSALKRNYERLGKTLLKAMTTRAALDTFSIFNLHTSFLDRREVNAKILKTLEDGLILFEEVSTGMQVPPAGHVIECWYYIIKGDDNFAVKATALTGLARK